MTKSNFFISFCLAAALIMSSCSKDPEFIIAGIELGDEFEITLHEDWNSTNTELFFKIRSSKVYNCDNLSLKSSLVKTLDNKLIINLQEVTANNEECNGQEQAQGFVNLGELENGAYQIEIALLGQLKSEGSLVISNSQYVLSLEENAGIKALNPEVKRTPAQTMFGYIVAKEAADQEVISNEFIDIMEAMGAPFENAGIYGRFEVQSNGNIRILDTSEDQSGTKWGFAISSTEEHQKLLDQIPENLCNDGHKMFVLSTSGLSKDCN